MQLHTLILVSLILGLFMSAKKKIEEVGGKGEIGWGTWIALAALINILGGAGVAVYVWMAERKSRSSLRRSSIADISLSPPKY